ncbi:CBU_1789 family Dot/Icm type IV secretion system effector [soil metagenome]
MRTVEVAVEAADLIGEGAIWCDRTCKLWWVDVRRPTVQSFEPGSGLHDVFALPEGLIVASIMLRASGGFVLASNRGFLAYRPGFEPTVLQDPLPIDGDMRLNDGRCDASGRIWCGSMLEHSRGPEGVLYRLDADGATSTHFRGLDIPNGIRWSPDGRTLYFADSSRHMVFASDFDQDEGAISDTRVLLDVTSSGAWPDGAAVDEDGCLWSTQNMGSCVLRISPRGGVIDRLQMPVSLITSCGFGGADLSTLFITTGRLRLLPHERAMQPLAGALFAAQVGVRGLREHRFAG